MGLSEYLLTVITGAHYYATPESEWGVLAEPFIQEWMVPQSETATNVVLRGGAEGTGFRGRRG